MGTLGFPLGTYLLIEGTRYAPEQPALVPTDCVLVVDTVNGKKLSKPIWIEIEGTVLTAGVRYLFKGYEDGAMRGQPPALDQADREAGREPPVLQQSGWYFEFRFIPTSIVSPK
jgi:hypothetical protein